MKFVVVDTESFMCCLCHVRHLLSLACIFYTGERRFWLVARPRCIVDYASWRIHKIPHSHAGVCLTSVLDEFHCAMERLSVTHLVAHDVSSDLSLLLQECTATKATTLLTYLCSIHHICTKLETMRLYRPSGRIVKWPSLREAFFTTVGLQLTVCHEATSDAEATACIFWYLTQLSKKQQNDTGRVLCSSDGQTAGPGIN